MEQTVNSFQKGLLMDTHPMIQGNEVLSDALNATYITAQGNEIILQNDMGNRKIEEAFLPPGYVPIGVKEYGGIIYVASYNPLTNRGLLGSFPSPERTSLYNYDGQEINFGFDTFMEKEFCFLKELSRIFTIYKNILHTGDKFTLFSVNELWSNPDYRNNISNFCNVTEDKVISPKNKQYTLSVGILDLTNNFIDITKDLNRYNVKENGKVEHLSKTGNEIFDFNNGYFLAEKTEGGLEDIVESYRKIVSEAGKGTLYKLKLNSPLCIKVLHNYPSKFEYTIKGKASSNKESIEKLIITATLEYNCPDGLGWSEGNEIYENFYTYSLFLTNWFNFYVKCKDDENLEYYSLLNNIDNGQTSMPELFGQNSIPEIFLNITNYISKFEAIKLLHKYNNTLSPSLNTGEKKRILGILTLLRLELFNSDTYKEEIVYDSNSNKYICKIKLTFENINFSKYNSNREHIVEYFIGVPYNLIEQSGNCNNPYIRSLSTFGEINIDLLNSDKFEIRKWIFTTSRLNENSDWKTSVEYEFNTGEEFTPFEIVLYDVNDLLHSTNTIQVRLANGSFEIIKESPADEVLGKAYKVEFRRDGLSLLKEGQFYWILCTLLFNDKNNTSDLLYVGNNYVEPINGIIKITNSDNIEKEINPKENLLKLLTIPVKAYMNSTLEDEESKVRRLNGEFNNENIITSTEDSVPIGKLIEKYLATISIDVGVEDFTINNSNENINSLYPKYILNKVKNIKNSNVLNNATITNNSLGEIEVRAGRNEGTMQYDDSINIDKNNLVITKEFNNSKFNIRGSINFDYIYTFKYVKLRSLHGGNDIKVFVSTNDDISSRFKCNGYRKLLFNVDNNGGYVTISENENNNLYLLDENAFGGPNKYILFSNLINYLGTTQVYDKDNYNLFSNTEIKNNFQKIFRSIETDLDVNMICTYFESSGSNIGRLDDNGNYSPIGNPCIFWLKTRRNSSENIEWTPVKYIKGTDVVNNIPEYLFKDFIWDNLLEAFNYIIDKEERININDRGGYNLFIPTRMERIGGDNTFIYAIYSSSSPSILDRIIKSLSQYNYGIWIKIPNGVFNLSGLKLDEGIDNILNIFNFEIADSSLEIELFDKFFAPIELTMDNYNLNIDPSEAPDAPDYYKIVTEDGKEIFKEEINRLENNWGKFYGTGCYLLVFDKNNDKHFYALNTRLLFIDGKTFDDIEVKPYPIVNGDMSKDNKYFGTESDFISVKNTQNGGTIRFNNDGKNLITHLFRYAGES